MAENRRIAQLAASLQVYLEELAEAGWDGVPLPPPSIAAASPTHPAQRSASGGKKPVVATATPAPPAVASGESLDAIRADLGDCRRCGLADSRSNLVFGVGDPGARLVFVGEAPGRDEDLQGEPFVGDAGQLLTKIIEAMGLSRQQVYICNVLKCRPPNNRNPQHDEIAQCAPFMLRQVKAINPGAIIALGTFAAQTLLETKEPIGRLRGRFHDYHGIPLMPTFHPAYLLRNASMKREVWEDVQKVMQLLGLPLPDKRGKGE